MTGTTDASRHLDGFEETVRDFWASRPRRSEEGRKVAGVAAGIGRRYGIDPVVIRVALVAVTIFGGVGIAVYLLAWLFMPAQSDEVSPFEALIGKGRSSMSKGGTVVLLAALVPAFGWTFGGAWFDGGGFLGLALIVTALYLMHRSRGHLNRPAPIGRPAAVTSAPIDLQNPASTSATWDALGAAPLGWDLPGAAPAPEPSEPGPPRRKSKIGIATLGVALAVAGVGAAVASSSADPWWSPAHVIGLVLAVLGMGMVAGAFLGGGRGLVWLAVPLSVAGIALTSVPFDQYGGGFGQITSTPYSAAEVQPLYERTAGEIDLDLRHLGGPAEPVRSTLRVGAGNIAVHVPTTADVTFDCSVGTGNVECFDRQQSGAGTAAVRGVDLGEDGPGGDRIILNIEAGLGNVEVHRGG
ncbi:PspC domain-containing protein [Prauserella oleivorans]|uniref:PspC domain-containing protein n=1 Tax=Prauserella oleivorans TaxID=1478153 RepID=A0ABW5W1I5_9PSEU